MSIENSFHWIQEKQVSFGERPGRWCDVRQDLEWLRAQGIRTILSLVEKETWIDVYQEAGFQTHHVPVNDYHAPEMDQIEECMRFIQADAPIYIHCVAGLGRAGTIAAAWLIYNGNLPIDAIRIIRKMRPGAIEVDEQFDALLEYAAIISTQRTQRAQS
jgi:atypical dual specificity phosphatase